MSEMTPFWRGSVNTLYVILAVLALFELQKGGPKRGVLGVQKGTSQKGCFQKADYFRPFNPLFRPPFWRVLKRHILPLLDLFYPLFDPFWTPKPGNLTPFGGHPGVVPMVYQWTSG
jgi:hypothetical protein